MVGRGMRWRETCSVLGGGVKREWGIRVMHINIVSCACLRLPSDGTGVHGMAIYFLFHIKFEQGLHFVRL